MWSDLYTAQVSFTDAGVCMNLTNESLLHSDTVRYFVLIVIFYCANTPALHMPDWEFSEGVVTLNCFAKWVDP